MHVKVGRKLNWTNRSVRLTQFYLSGEDSGPLSAMDVGVVEQSTANSAQVKINGHNYDRNALVLTDTDHIRGASRDLIQRGGSLASMVLDCMIDVLSTSTDHEMIKSACKCIINWQFDHSSLETLLFGLIFEKLSTFLKDASLPLDALSAVLSAAVALSKESTTPKIQGLYPSLQNGEANISFDRLVSRF